MHNSVKGYTKSTGRLSLRRVQSDKKEADKFISNVISSECRGGVKSMVSMCAVNQLSNFVSDFLQGSVRSPNHLNHSLHSL